MNCLLLIEKKQKCVFLSLRIKKNVLIVTIKVKKKQIPVLKIVKEAQKMVKYGIQGTGN